MLICQLCLDSSSAAESGTEPNARLKLPGISSLHSLLGLWSSYFSILTGSHGGEGWQKESFTPPCSPLHSINCSALNHTTNVQIRGKEKITSCTLALGVRGESCLCTSPVFSSECSDPHQVRCLQWKSVTEPADFTLSNSKLPVPTLPQGLYSKLVSPQHQ